MEYVTDVGADVLAEAGGGAEARADCFSMSVGLSGYSAFKGLITSLITPYQLYIVVSGSYTPIFSCNGFWRCIIA